jgi:hypothetical protein
VVIPVEDTGIIGHPEVVVDRAVIK